LSEIFEIVAVCDIHELRAKDAAKKFNAEPYTKYDRFLKKADIDIVSVVTPNYLHARHTIAALETGKHVFIRETYGFNGYRLQRQG